MNARAGARSVEQARERLLAPLSKAIEARPDMAVLKWVEASLLRQIGDVRGAEAALAAVLAKIPAFREARWERDQILVERWTEPSGAEPSDYAGALERIRAEGERLGRTSLAPQIAEGVLRYRLGEWDRAAALLQPIVAGWPAGDDLRQKTKASVAYREAWGQELGFRRADDAKGNLPRVRLSTSKGDVLLELYEDDAPNTVANFVWLARHKCFDGTTFHRVIPFFMAQAGDPLSKAGDARVGAGGPGYAIRTERSRRRPFRGVIAMARFARPDTEGSQFFVTTGTSAHLEGEYSVFGRVLEGQEVVDRVVSGDVVNAVEVVRARDHEYRPTTVAGAPAPEPKCR